MTKRLLLLILLPLALTAQDITMAHAKEETLGKIVSVNAQITQLSSQKQKIVSRLPGHVEHYFVTPGQQVKEGDKVVLIESIALSKMTAEYLALKEQAKAAKQKLETARKLYKKGLTSQSEFNQAIIEAENVLSRLNALRSQLDSLGIDTATLKKATDQFTLYAHGDGMVGDIFVPLHSNVDAEEPLMSIVNQNAFYAVAYLSVADAMHLSNKSSGEIHYAGESYKAHFVQLMPVIDEETQRARALFALDTHPKNTLINTFTQMQVALPPYTKAVTVSKNALSLFKGEWVVFVEKEHDEAHEKAEHKSKEEAHEHEEEEHDEAEHGEHEHEESPYAPKVVEPIAYFGDRVAVKGLEAGEEYVASGIYFVKSMMLKSSLGGHGH